MAQHIYELKFKPKRPNGKIQEIPKLFNKLQRLQVILQTSKHYNLISGKIESSSTMESSTI
jgi:hypothetical protein